MLFALSLASNAAANENSKMTPGTIAVVNNPDSNDRLNLRTNPSPDAPTLGKYYNGTYLSPQRAAAASAHPRPEGLFGAVGSSGRKC